MSIGVPLLLLQLLLLHVSQSMSTGSLDGKSTSRTNTDYSEKLLIRPLQDGMLSASFQFDTILHQNIESLYLENQFDIFPLAIGDFIGKNFIKELRFSLARGHWKSDQWGYPLRYQPNGGELYAVFSHLNSNPWKSWKQVTSSLSGHFCASLNFIDKAATVQPRYSLKPEGVFGNGSFKQENVFYAALAHETVCTENLTPWKKFLPCFHKSGLASLLNAVYLLNSNYFSISIDIKSKCGNPACSKSFTELKQNVLVVFNPPAIFGGKLRWSIIKLFGSTLKESCPLASKSEVFVETTLNDTRNPHTISPTPHNIIVEESSSGKRTFFQYDVERLLTESKRANSSKFNIFSVYQHEKIYDDISPPPISASRYITGYGVHQGGITSRISNNAHKSKTVVVLDVIPWYLRIYLHTMKITCNGEDLKPSHLYYKPSRDRGNPHHIEIVLKLPPDSVTEISYEFERSFLKWTEYQPDANHGVYAGSSTLTFLLDDSTNATIFPSNLREARPLIIPLKTECLLVSLPTPDFSMPYNVICLVSTVVSLAFGPIHNLTTKRPKRVKSGKESSSRSILSSLKFWAKEKSD
ncbi:phosphatidylinositol glycan anchor biosynthesis class T [Brevipalpus obovatus]|uniref:phosphatidylinositol glycan anchor biosynthesis class T n=1 Tax=Brevipalpus obovatus TaxID=246614 RepID=UPI003D9E12AF